MTYTSLFFVLVAILLASYLLERILSKLNLEYSLPELPGELEGIFDKEEYRKSQLYKRDNTRFSLVSSSISLAVILLFLFLGGFGWLDRLLDGVTDVYLLKVLLFFGILALASDLLSTPFSAYDTFVLEERYGFNRTTVPTFVLDKLKGWLLGAIIGGGILALITWLYELTGEWFWVLALGVITLFSLFMSMFYSNLIVPLFNKQTPLEEGSLRLKIEAFSKSAHFKLDNIYTMDGSKRSSRANAYFTGLGPKKRIVLFDTLVDDLEEEEIVSVLAHEVGHYKKKHTLSGFLSGTLQSAFTLYLFSLFVGVDAFAVALGGDAASFHLGLVAFGILYSPVSTLLGLLGNYLSRRHEYQADRYAKQHYSGEALISSLKKLSKNNLSNLTPHPAYVFFHYSHPTLLQRIRALRGEASKRTNN